MSTIVEWLLFFIHSMLEQKDKDNNQFGRKGVKEIPKELSLLKSYFQ